MLGAATEYRRSSRAACEIIIVDDASTDETIDWLEKVFESEVNWLRRQRNGGFAVACNNGFRAARYPLLLLLNNDVVLAPDAAARLLAVLDATPGAGIVGPRVVDMTRQELVLSAGERHSLPLLCLPRTLLRYRRTADAPYLVSGVMGCALLVTRACFQAVGGFSTEIEVYYEDVDFCVGARERGFRAVIEPRAVAYHDGLRGLARGLTPWAGFLKARNPWLLMRRRGGPVSWITFVPLYGAMITATIVLYVLRGRIDVACALGRGAIAGLRVAAGAPLKPIGPPLRGA